MSNVDITVSLPVELVERARNRGILNDQRIALLLEAEIERIERWRDLDRALEPVREAFRAEYGHMTEDEVMDMINETVHEVRAEMRAEREAKTPGPSES
jgi:hypothetical protein